MRVPFTWLREHCDPGLDAHALAERLTMTGTKVERVTHHGVGEAEHFVFGRVLEVARHPDADRLSVCTVDVGAGDGPAQIVCGAPNVAAGQTVAVARPGAVMPDGSRLGRARLRGIESDGMILAEDELAIGADHEGILVLDGDHAPGTPLTEILEIETEVLELEITPNRPDCLGIHGVAREVHAATGAPLRALATGGSEEPGDQPPPSSARVDIEVPELCPRFTARVYEDVRIGPSPPWLKARLMAAGQRPISNVVDVTNYVMLLTGHPLHAFDLDDVAGGRLVVRRARDGERMRTLDGSERELDGEMVVICDDDGPTSIAGVMGGERSEVHAETTRVLMEAASWIGHNIHRTSTRLALRSEASARFEKGLSPEAALEAQEVAARLMIEVCGATATPGTIDVSEPLPAQQVVALRPRRATALLGVEMSADRCRAILEALGFSTAGDDERIDATVPHFRRGDVTREADLIEEVARIDGVERLPATLPARRGASGRLTTFQRLQRRTEDVLVGRGVSEIVGWSYNSPSTADRLALDAADPRRGPVTLLNPMSEEQSAMRWTLLGSLMDAARHNASHGRGDVALFESGAVYRKGQGSLAEERHLLGCLLSGRPWPAGWRGTASPEADYFTAKALTEAVLGAAGVAAQYSPLAEPFLHPGRAASISVADRVIGWIGEVHPLVAGEWELERRTVAFEVDLRELAACWSPVRAHSDLTSFPAVHQDMAIVVGEDVSAARVLETVRASAGELLAGARVFDVYRGEQAGAGSVSLAVALEFRAPDRTLTDEEVAGLRDRITAALESELGGRLRA